MTNDVNALQTLDSEEMEATSANPPECTYTCYWTSW
ncbi:ALQxL family class IV lanthipeptide [Kitasatospora sp. MAP5-34]|nr:ALQxL family class IV lanthipeptide [Kitasatospora sp. MAP5-34]MDH6580162.1 hypothetical protein [Kitasatospora sp. MAP5-34]